MPQQVSCEPGVVPAALHQRDPRSLSSDTLLAPQQCADWPVQGGGVPSLAALYMLRPPRELAVMPQLGVGHKNAIEESLGRRAWIEGQG